MKLVRALIIVLILLSVISKLSVIAYQKDMDVLTTMNEIEQQDPKFAIQEQARAKRASVIISYAMGICTAAFFISFLFSKKLRLSDAAEKDK